jgi:predicted dehydrogenase
MCAYPVRYWPGIVKLKELLDSGEYGKVFMMSVWTEQLTVAKGWSATARLGGGQFFSHGCHYVDLLLWFLGKPVKGMHFGTKVGTPWMMREGTSAAVIQFESGALGYHGATWGARGTRLGYDFQIQTEQGLLEYEKKSGEVRLYNKNAEHRPGDDENAEYTVLFRDPAAKTKQTQHEILHFVDCIRTGKKPMTDARSVLQGLRIIWKMYDAEKHDVVADLRGLGMEEYLSTFHSTP